MHEIASRLLGDFEKDVREIEALISDGRVSFQYVARHVSGPNPELDHMVIGHAGLADLSQNEIEESEAIPRRHKAIRPTAHEIGIVKFVLSTDVAGHRRSRCPHASRSSRAIPSPGGSAR